jgi:hypothetical protein
MAWKQFKLATTHVGAGIAGLGVGCLLFHAPEWVCGPLRSDLVPLWAAAAAGGLAAWATYYAATVALRAGRDAISNERELRNAELQATKAEHIRRQKALATVFIAPMFAICLNCETWRILLSNEDISLEHVIQLIREKKHTDVIDALIGNVLEFDGEVLSKFGVTYGMLKSIFATAINFEVEKVDDAKELQRQRDILIGNAQQVAKNSRASWEALLALCDDVKVTSDPLISAQKYADSIVANALRRGRTST